MRLLKKNDLMALEFVEPIEVDITKTVLDDSKLRVFIVGDSTACNYQWRGKENRYPQTGWGQVFQERFDDKIQVINCALSGRSALSFKREINYQYLCDHIRKGDYLLIQFAHNDCKKEDPSRYSSPEDGTYQDNIYGYIDLARNIGANPILCTSITRNLPEDHTLEPYGAALKELAEKEALPLLDLYHITHALLLRDGAEARGKMHMNLPPHDERFMNYPEFADSQYYEGRSDNTHLNLIGAREIAGFVSDELKRVQSPLAEYLK